MDQMGLSLSLSVGLTCFGQQKTPQKFLGTQWAAVVVRSIEPPQAVWPALDLEHECQVRELGDSSSSSSLQVREPPENPIEERVSRYLSQEWTGQ